MPGTPQGCELDVLLSEGCFTVCIDDVVYSDAKRVRELRDFVSKFKSNRFIITATTFRQNNRISPSQNLGAHFERIRLHQLRRQDLRKLARKIDTTDGVEDELLERVIRVRTHSQ